MTKQEEAVLIYEVHTVYLTSSRAVRVLRMDHKAQ